MSVRIGLDGDAFGRARGEVVAAHHDLERGAASLWQGARDLLGGWRGVAAGQYARAWAEWEDGTARVLRSLLDLSGAMEVARGRLGGSDAEAAARASYLRSRLEGES